MTNKPKTIEEINKEFDKKDRGGGNFGTMTPSEVKAFFQSQYTQLFKEWVGENLKVWIYDGTYKIPKSDFRIKQAGAKYAEVVNETKDSIRSRAKQGGMEI